MGNDKHRATVERRDTTRVRIDTLATGDWFINAAGIAWMVLDDDDMRAGLVGAVRTDGLVTHLSGESVVQPLTNVRISYTVPA